VIQRSLRTHYARNRVPKVSATDSYNTDAPARLSDVRATGPGQLLKYRHYTHNAKVTA